MSPPLTRLKEQTTPNPVQRPRTLLPLFTKYVRSPSPPSSRTHPPLHRRPFFLTTRAPFPPTPHHRNTCTCASLCNTLHTSICPTHIGLGIAFRVPTFLTWGAIVLLLCRPQCCHHPLPHHHLHFKPCCHCPFATAHFHTRAAAAAASVGPSTDTIFEKGVDEI